MSINQIFVIQFNEKTNELTIEKARDNFIDTFDWINKEVFYGSKGIGIYCDEEHIECCKNKLMLELIKEQEEVIKKATKRLNRLKEIKVNEK